MENIVSLISVFFAINIANANYQLPIGEPRIECTVIKILSDEEKFGDTSFPELYESIYNDNLKSQLFIGGKELRETNPQQFFKQEKIEKIKIKYQSDIMNLEIRGKPISRNGKLSINGKYVADITCH